MPALEDEVAKDVLQIVNLVLETRVLPGNEQFFSSMLLRNPEGFWLQSNSHESLLSSLKSELFAASNS